MNSAAIATVLTLSQSQRDDIDDWMDICLVEVELLRLLRVTAVGRT